MHHRICIPHPFQRPHYAVPAHHAHRAHRLWDMYLHAHTPSGRAKRRWQALRVAVMVTHELLPSGFAKAKAAKKKETMLKLRERSITRSRSRKAAEQGDMV